MNVLRSYSSDNELKQNKIDLKEGFHTLRWGGGVEGFELPEGVMPPRGSQGFIESFSVVPENIMRSFHMGITRRYQVLRFYQTQEMK